jgi:hypothetical protein
MVRILGITGFVTVTASEHATASFGCGQGCFGPGADRFAFMLALGIRLDAVNHRSQDRPFVRVEVAWRALLHRDECVARQLRRRWRPEKQPLMPAMIVEYDRN